MLSPTQKADVRHWISNFCVIAEEYRLKWYYQEVRPFHGFGLAPSDYHTADCSAYVSLVFNWAMHKTGIYLHDPLNESYSGWGYTGTQYDYLKAHQAPVDRYLVGDMAIFGQTFDTIHTSICRHEGDGETAIFSSNGRGSSNFSQDAPEPTRLAEARLQQPLVGVFRHPQLL